MKRLAKYPKHRVIRSGLALILAGCFLLSCQHSRGVSKSRQSASQSRKLKLPTKSVQQKIVKMAQKYIGKRRVGSQRQRFRADCSGSVRGIYKMAGYPLKGRVRHKSDNDVKVIAQYIQDNGVIHYKKPLPGSLIFFHKTYDLNNNGRVDDRYTHVGIVEKVMPDGTVVFIHHLNKLIVRSRMNLFHKSRRRNPNNGEKLNDILRRGSLFSAPKTTAQLFAGFGQLDFS